MSIVSEAEQNQLGILTGNFWCRRQIRNRTELALAILAFHCIRSSTESVKATSAVPFVSEVEHN